MKPIIGISPSYDIENKRIFLNKQYIDAVIESGGIPFVLPFSSDQKTIYEIIKNIAFLNNANGKQSLRCLVSEQNSGTYCVVPVWNSG